MPNSDEYSQASVTVVVFCVVDDDAELLDLVRADVCDAVRKTEAARARELFQFQGPVGKATKFPQKRLDRTNKNNDANTNMKTLYKTKENGKVYELLKVLFQRPHTLYKIRRS